MTEKEIIIKETICILNALQCLDPINSDTYIDIQPAKNILNEIKVKLQKKYLTLDK